MISLALEKAKSRLRSSANALDALKAAVEADLDDEVADLWTDFITHWKATYSKVQQAAKETPQELQWFGEVNKERRKDPLLRYLFEARNDEEHGLVQSVRRDIGLYCFRGNLPDGGLSDLQISTGPNGEPQISDSSGHTTLDLVNQYGGGISLRSVTERDGKKKVPPPTTHFDEPIAPLPIPVAEAGLRYLTNLVRIAEALDGE